MISDVINGSFELLGGCLVWLNVRQTFKDKMVRGVSIVPTAFFGLWGFWNLYFYPSLGQIWSFFGGLNVVVSNAVWVYLMWKYRNNGNDKEGLHPAGGLHPPK